MSIDGVEIDGVEYDTVRGLMAAIARAHYLDGLSRVEIAERFGISRFRVARLLERARDEGIVTIRINDSGLPDQALADRLRDALGLRLCRVVRSHGDDDAVRHQVGAVAARFLSDSVAENEILGIAWGRTRTAMMTQLTHLPRLTVVQLTGFVAGDLESSPIAVIRHAALRSGGDVFPIFAPLYVRDLATAQSLREHPDIRAAMELFPKVTTAVLSVGAWDTDASQLKKAVPPGEEPDDGITSWYADIAGILLNEDGTQLDPEFEQRSISITFEQLRAVPRVIAVAGGAEKAGAVKAVARAGLIEELITDHKLALKILGED